MQEDRFESRTMLGCEAVGSCTRKCIRVRLSECISNSMFYKRPYYRLISSRWRISQTKADLWTWIAIGTSEVITFVTDCNDYEFSRRLYQHSNTPMVFNLVKWTHCFQKGRYYPEKSQILKSIHRSTVLIGWWYVSRLVEKTKSNLANVGSVHEYRDFLSHTEHVGRKWTFLFHERRLIYRRKFHKCSIKRRIKSHM